MTGKKQPTVEPAGEPSTAVTNPETTMTTESTSELADMIETDPQTEVEEEPDTDEEDETETEDTSEKPELNPTPSSCTECGNESLTRSDKHAETTCDDCGEIVETREFPETAGWKRHASKTHTTETSVTDNNNSGISMNPLGGTIDWKDMDGYGSSLSSKKRSRMHRLRQLDQNLDSGNPKTSNYKYALGEINRMAAGISVPRHVRDTASDLYEQILEDDLLSGRAIEAVATATLFAACEEKNVSRDLSEIAEYSHADYAEVADTYEGLVRDLGLNDYGVEVTTHVPALCSALDLDDDVKEIASGILRNTVTAEHLEEGTLMEHTAAAVYAAVLRTGDLMTQSKIATVADVPVNGIRSRYQEHLETAAFNTAY